MPQVVNPARSVDHLILACPDPEAALHEFVATTGAPVLTPVQDFGFFQSGLVRLANIDLEFLRLGARAPARPFLYGIAFAPRTGVWETARWLRTAGIPSSIPVTTTVAHSGRDFRWTVTMLGGLLDDPIPAGYSNGVLAGDGPLARGAAWVSGLALRVPGMRRMLARDTGSSMALFCHYHADVSHAAELERQFAASGGGPLRLRRLRELVVETSTSRSRWEAITAGLDEPSSIRCVPGKRNALVEVVLECAAGAAPRVVQIGDAVFRCVASTS